MNEEGQLNDMKNKILVCSDSKSLKESIRIILGNEYQLISGSFLKDFKEVAKKEEADVAILEIGSLTDTKINSMYEINSLFNDLPFIILFADYNEDNLVSIFGRKNRIFLKIPSEIFDLKDKIEILMNKRWLENSMEKVIEENITDDKYLISSNLLKFGNEVIRLLKKATPIKASVLISGEGGTGRELAARIIHYSSSRKGKFVNINCSSLNLKELTSIFKDEAESGFQKEESLYRTIYFNKIEDLSCELQMALSEFLDLGGIITENGKFKKFNGRIVASTSKNLFYEMRQNRFDPKLFYKISLFPINIAPLRDRKDEIPLIVNMILSEGMKNLNIIKKSFTQDAMELFQNYLWPLNLMELENIVLRAAVLSENEVISADEISPLFGDIQKKSMIEKSSLSDSIKTDSVNFKIAKSHGITNYNDNLILELAHEIKNPLVAIKTFANLFPENFNDPDFRENFYKIVSRDVERIDSLVERILEYQNVLSVKGKREPLSSILNKTIKSFSKEFEKRKIFIYKDISNDLSKICVENNKFECVFKNIISKLIKEAGEGGGEIKFSAKAEHNNDIDAENIFKDAVDLHIKAKSKKREDDEISQEIKDNYSEMKGIEIFLAEQLIKYSCGRMTINTFNNNGIDVSILLPIISGPYKEI